MSSRDSTTVDGDVATDSLLLVTTSDEQELLDGDLFSLLGSLDENARAVVVLRDVRADLAAGVQDHPRVVGVVATPRVGISVARNAALDWIAEHRLASPGTIIAFPDDDCRYPSGLVGTVHEAMSRHGCAVLLGSYGPSDAEIDRERFPDAVVQVKGWAELPVVASAGIFLSWGALDGLRFNPNLGVGAALPAAEEIDLLLRLLSRGITVTYDPRVNVLHPYRTRADPFSRWEAWIALCTGHALARPRLAPKAVRAWAGLVQRLVRRQITLRYALGVARRAANVPAINSIRVLAREARRRV